MKDIKNYITAIAYIIIPIIILTYGIMVRDNYIIFVSPFVITYGIYTLVNDNPMIKC